MELFFKVFPTFLQGTLCILIIYHCSTYFFTKDKSFAIYAGYLFLVLVYLIPKTPNDFSNAIVIKFSAFFKASNWVIQVFYWVLYTWFSIHFLNIEQKDKKLSKNIYIYVFASFIISLVVFLIDLFFFKGAYFSKYFIFVYMPISLFVIGFFLKVIYNFKDKINSFFVVGFLFFLGFSLVSLYFSLSNIYTFGYIRPIDFFMIGICLEALVISVGLGYKYHIYRQERDNYNKLLIEEFQKNEKLKDQLNEKLSEKVEHYKLSEIEALYEKQINELKLTSLLSQMNPHFIFNVLNSIKLYIINNESKLAARYLNKFSKLIRKILEASNTKEISLQEELETMDLYMTIENIRFSNEIDFQIKVDENVSLETIKVPPLVLQPFLENALWHGLSSKKEDKKIVLSIDKKEANFIQFTIKDNGIGRAASAKIKSEKSINRKSIGIALTKDRLANFVKGSQKNYSINYTDLKDENGKALGTKVMVKIPLL
ncbi:sensor histidine kinase [Polaribacter cellanae]|nr:histidine kinase [Polaribacter cellanae]